MWEKIKAAAQHPAARMVKKICGDPVQLYAVFLVMTIMYYYHANWAWLYTLLTIGISFVLMRFYDFVAKKKLIGPVSYLIYLFVGLYAVSMIVNVEQRRYPIGFAVWFLTPQSVVDFSMLYTISIYLLMTGFLTSAVYYFAKVRYRMTMQFLIMLIPLSLYAKEGLQMPALLVIMLLASYFLLMVYCRQLRESPQIRHISGFHTGMSVAIYVMAFSILAAIIPKPALEADREFIDNAMSYSSWSDILMNAISMFTDTTDNTAATNNNARTLYYVNSPESLRLRTQTYTYYGEDDSWTVVEEYDRPQGVLKEPLTYKPQELLQAISDAAAADPDFAEQYGLTEIAGQVLPEQRENEFYIYSWYTFSVLPSPTRTKELTEGIAKSSVLVSANNTFETSFRGATLHYYPDTYARYEAVSAILRKLNHDSYPLLLWNAAEVMHGTPAEELLLEAYTEALQADMLLLEADVRDWHADTINDLAAELTEGLTSDLDKALAIEQYFTLEGYVYDDAYQKAEGDNIEDFLLTSHRGVCYEYATAMVLLCRSAGLPARYVQGYNLMERYDSNTTNRYNPYGRETNYVIKARNAHAFPEVYIAGYGWLSFEPTVASDEVDNGIAENLNVMRWGYTLLGLMVLVLIGWMMMPYIRERHFRRSISRMTAQQCASAIFRQMRTQLRLADSTTVSELAERSAPFFRKETLFTEIDVLLYSHSSEPTTTAGALATDYVQWQTDRKTYEKEQKQLRREQKKQKRKN